MQHRGRGRGPPSKSGMSLPSVNMNISAMSINTSQISKTAEALFSNHLASALSTIGDSQYFQDSISPSTIRNNFETNPDPSSPTAIPVLLTSMKWLLASMSKGRDVSDFFPHVVKLVSSQSLEIRKMVYTYFTHYADHNSTCRDLVLLSINAFQRDLSDSNHYIRPLALRVLTSIRVMDVLQIQILAVQSCFKDESAHVRKCAANALAKLYPRSDEATQHVLKDLLKELLLKESSTEVLSSAMVAFMEMCPADLHLLHGCFRKVCHLLTDMDEWGQIMVMDVLQGYCRKFFRNPKVSAGIQNAEVIDMQKRVVRRINDDGTIVIGGETYDFDGGGIDDMFGNSNGKQSAKQGVTITPSKKQKRRFIRKGFYSDDEDESSEDEEDNLHIPLPGGNTRDRVPGQSVANALRSPFRPQHFAGNKANQNGIVGVNEAGLGEDDNALDEDHRLLLRSCLPLLKSRNAGVVLGVCSLHYYCGVASIKVRSSLGKALVRIYHDRREIQFVVLNSIRMLVWECPSAFTPFLNDFFVKAMDPSFTRFMKLDILSALCLEPNSVDAVLKELRLYIRHDDKAFVCASIRTVGKIVEMARIVHDRQGVKVGQVIEARNRANEIALNCLHGILTLSECSDNEAVVGECVDVMQRIMSILSDDDGGRAINDQMHVQNISFKRLLLLVVRSLSGLNEKESDADEDEDATVDPNSTGAAMKAIIKLPTDKIPSALWILGEVMTSTSTSISMIQLKKSEKETFRTELLRLVAKAFADMDDKLKCHSIHFASKVLLIEASLDERTLCEFILSLGRTDMNQDVRDRSRNESLLLHMTEGLKYDSDSLPPVPKKISIEKAKAMLLQRKPSPSWLPIETGGDQHTNAFRFGTLSSMVSRKAGTSYTPLPSWAEVDSPKNLRDPPKRAPAPTVKSKQRQNGYAVDNSKTSTGFYDSSSSSDDSSSSDSSSDSDSSSSSSDDNSSSDDDSSSDDNDDESTSSEDTTPRISTKKGSLASESIPTGQRRQIMPTTVTKERQIPSLDLDSSSDDETSEDDSSSSDDESSSSDESSNENKNVKSTPVGLIDTSYESKNPYQIQNGMNNIQESISSLKKPEESAMSSLTSGLEGLVMAPLVVDKDAEVSETDIEIESSNWKVLVRHDLSGGLVASIRFLRGSIRAREANLLGFDPNNSAVICLQIRFENKRSDGRAIRRIHLMQKKVTKSGIIPTSRISIPQEISSLESMKVSSAIIGLEFAQASDKEGALLAKFDLKCDRGTTPIDICPPLAETVKPSPISVEKFDESIMKLQGIHQQSKATFNVPLSDLKSFKKQVESNILKATSMVSRNNNIKHLYFSFSKSRIKTLTYLSSSHKVICG